MVEIYSKSLVGAKGEVGPITLEHQLEDQYP